jgi:hypothetical protein
MITDTDVLASLRPGDVVELTHKLWPAGTVLRGPVYADTSELGRGDLRIGFVTLVHDLSDDPDYTLTVISRAPYVNHARTEPRHRDVAIIDDDYYSHSFTYIYGGEGHWRTQHGEVADLSRARLRLLIDGQTGQVVP